MSLSRNSALIKSAFDYFAHCGPRFESRVLLDTGETSALPKRYFPAVGSDLAPQNSEKGGFTGSVRANQADAVSIRNGEGNILEERVRSECFRNLLGVDNGRQ